MRHRGPKPLIPSNEKVQKNYCLLKKMSVKLSYKQDPSAKKTTSKDRETLNSQEEPTQHGFY